jgi:branched-subunit amino acid transport protein
MWTRTFWKRTVERAVKTVAQTALGALGAAAVVESVDWQFVASASLLAGVISVLTSMASANAGPDPESPSVV